MLKQILTGTAAVAVMGLVAPAMAGNTDTFDVLVNINVLEEVSMWPDAANINLVLSGANPENMDVVQSGINYISNVGADIHCGGRRKFAG